MIPIGLDMADLTLMRQLHVDLEKHRQNYLDEQEALLGLELFKQCMAIEIHLMSFEIP